MSYKRTSPMPVAEGGTGDTTLTLDGVLIGNGTSAIAVTAAGTNGQVLTGNTGAAPTFQTPASSSITITGNSGGGQTSNAFTFTGGTTGLTFAGATDTFTLGGTLVVADGGTGATTLTGVLIGNGTSAVTGNAITQYDVLIGGASNAISSVAPSATSGVPLISQGTLANPTFGTAVVAGGGTGITSATAYAPIVGGTTTTGAFQSASTGIATAGYVLTSNGASSIPSFQAQGASSITITGDSGGGLTGNAFTFTGGTTGLTFAGAGSTETLGGTLVVANGGTGVATLTAYSPLVGGTTTTGPVQSASTGQSNVGYVLTSTGSSSVPTWQNSTGMGSLVLISTQSPAGVGSITFTSGISSTYYNYLLILDVVAVTGTGVSDILLQVSTDGGSTYKTSGYYNSFAGVFGASTSGMTVNTVYNLTNYDNSVVYLNFSPAVHPSMNCSQNNYQTNTSTGTANQAGAWYIAGTLTVNAFKLVLGNSCTMTGTISLYGIAK